MWEELAFVLRDPELTRAVCYRAMRGDKANEVVSAPACFAAAFEQMLERRPQESDVRTVAAFLVHLNALCAIAEARLRDRRRSELLNQVLAPDRAGARPRGLATFFALPDAVGTVEPRLSQPPGLEDDPAVLERWRQHRAQVRAELGEPVLDALATKLARHLAAAAS